MRLSRPLPSVSRVLIQLAADSRSPEMASVFHFLALSGLRRGELCALRWSRVDWDGARVYVSRSIWQQSMSAWARRTRRRTRPRGCRWAKWACRYCARAKSAQRADAEAVGLMLNPDGYIWSSDPAGTEPFRPDRITQAFRRAVPAGGGSGSEGRSGGREGPLRSRGMASPSARTAPLLGDGAVRRRRDSLHAVQKHLRHSLGSTTANIYGHGREGDGEKVAAILGASIRLAEPVAR